MAELGNPLEELFCELFVQYQNASKAYTESYAAKQVRREQLRLLEQTDPVAAGQLVVNESSKLLRKPHIRRRIEEIYTEAHDLHGVGTGEIVSKYRRAYQTADSVDDAKGMVLATNGLATIAGLIPDKYNRIIAPNVSITFAGQAGDPARLSDAELVWFRYLQAKFQGTPDVELRRLAPYEVLEPPVPALANQPQYIEATARIIET